MPYTDNFEADRHNEIERWTEYHGKLKEATKRCEEVLDTLDGMDARSHMRPHVLSDERQAELTDRLLPIVKAAARHGYAPEDTANMLRQAAEEIEEEGMGEVEDRYGYSVDEYTAPSGEDE